MRFRHIEHFRINPNTWPPFARATPKSAIRLLHTARAKGGGPVSRPSIVSSLRLRHLRPGRSRRGRLFLLLQLIEKASTAAGRPAERRRRRGAVEPPVGCRIEPGLRWKPARIDRTRLVVKNAAARKAVARVSTLAVPRLVRNPPPYPPIAQSAAFRLLQQHDADQARNNHQMDHNNNGLHQDYPLSGRTGRAGTPAIWEVAGVSTRSPTAFLRLGSGLQGL